MNPIRESVKAMKLMWEKSKMLSLWLVAIVGTIPFTLISMPEYFWTVPPTITQGINSVVFILIWLLVGLYMGTKKNKYFLKFTLIYYSYLILSILLGFINALFSIVAFALMLAGPFTGLAYFISTDANFHLWGSVATLILVILSYFSGSFFNRSGSNGITT